MERAQTAAILQDLEKKMVLLAGPRQAGKTWLAKQLAKRFEHSTYLNYDFTEDLQRIQAHEWPKNTELLILDEIHKMPEWKNFLKGIYDTKPENMRILVTGSAGLELFYNAGDSLAGRYFLHHLLPFTPSELKQINEPIDIDRFLSHSGFPEPFTSDSSIDVARWRNQYAEDLIKIDVLEFDNVHHVKNVKLLFEILQTRVGQPISYQSLAEDIHISINTVKRYLQILETLYIVFRVSPFSKNIARGISKMPKFYFLDTGLVKGDKGVIFENFIATCLLKHCYQQQDYTAQNMQLQYLRTRENQEVDFALVKDQNIQEILEIKLSDEKPTQALKYFSEKYNLPATQLVKNCRQALSVNGIQISNPEKYLERL